jgi:glycerol kinase
MTDETAQQRERTDAGEQPPAQNDERFIGSIDQGTTSSRFLIFSKEADPVASHHIEFENLYPESGSVSTPSSST